MPKQIQWTIGMLCGLALFALQIYGFYKTHQASNWPSTTGHVVASEYKRTGKTHSTIVAYEYYLGGKKYASHNIRFAGFSFGTSTLDRYPRGKVVQVYYNPDDPKDAVLETEFPLTAYVAMIGGMVIFAIFAVPLFGQDETEPATTQEPSLSTGSTQFC